MRERFDAREVWEFLGMPVDKCVEAAMISENQRIFRANLFSRIVPTVRDIGLWGPKVKQAYQDMGVMQFADTDIEARLAADEKWALDLSMAWGDVRWCADPLLPLVFHPCRRCGRRVTFDGAPIRLFPPHDAVHAVRPAAIC